MYRMLLVDDEPNILRALRRSLSTGWQDGPEMVIECFTSANEALHRLEDEDFDIVMSDFRMPEMNGVQFLSRVIEVNPGANRMLMSAYADRDTALLAINEANVAKFVCKPWDDNELRATIGEVLAARGHGGAASAGTRIKTTQNVRRRLEEECPGILDVDRAEDGGIILADYSDSPDADWHV